MSIDYTRGDSPAYDGYREAWASQREEELQARIDELETQLAERDRRLEAAHLIVDERDTLMKRHSAQVEAIRKRIDNGGLSDDEKQFLWDLCFETNYDRRNAGMEGEG